MEILDNRLFALALVLMVWLTSVMSFAQCMFIHIADFNKWILEFNLISNLHIYKKMGPDICFKGHDKKTCTKSCRLKALVKSKWGFSVDFVIKGGV